MRPPADSWRCLSIDRERKKNRIFGLLIMHIPMCSFRSSCIFISRMESNDVKKKKTSKYDETAYTRVLIKVRPGRFKSNEQRGKRERGVYVYI